MKQLISIALLLATLTGVHAADKFTQPGGNSLADAVQWLAVRIACTSQYAGAETGDFTMADPDDLYRPTHIREYLATESSGGRTKVDMIYGICFNYAQAAYEYITRNQSHYVNLGVKAWYIAGVYRNSGEIFLYDTVSREQADLRQNGVYVKIASQKNIQAHGNATLHAWLWVIANDGTIYWIDPTWTDNSGFIWWGVVRNGREELVAPAARLCATGIPRGLAFAPFSRGDAARNQGDYDQAIIDYNEAARIEPNYAVAYNNRGDAYYKKGDYDRAIADYTEAIRLDPNYAAAYGNRAAAYLAKGDLNRAIADCDQAINLDSELVPAYSTRGSVYLAKGEIDKALADYNQALSLDPNYVRALYGRAQVHIAKRDYDQALADSVKAINLWPKEPAFYVPAGEAYHHKGDFQKAIPVYDLALKIVPLPGSIGLNRARVNELMSLAKRRRKP